MQFKFLCIHTKHNHELKTYVILQAKKWDLSPGSIWNTVVWLMLLNFSAKIVNTTAKSYLREQQEKELAALENNRARG